MSIKTYKLWQKILSGIVGAVIAVDESILWKEIDAPSVIQSVGPDPFDEGLGLDVPVGVGIDGITVLEARLQELVPVLVVQLALRCRACVVTKFLDVAGLHRLVTGCTAHGLGVSGIIRGREAAVIGEDPGL